MNEQRAEFGEDGNATVTGYATCYSFNPDNGEYFDSFEFFTLIGSGIPGSSTLLPPPATKDKEIAVFKNGEWTIANDYRGETVYSKKDGSIKFIGAIGDYSDDFTPLKPNTKYDVWSGSSWVTDEDLKNKGLIEDNTKTRDKLQAQATARINVLIDATDPDIMGEDLLESEVVLLKAWKSYRVKLSRIDLANPVWPVKPE